MKRHYQQQNDEGSILSMGGHIKHCKAKRNVVTTAPTTIVCASYFDLQKKQVIFDTGFVEFGNDTRVKGNQTSSIFH